MMWFDLLVAKGVNNSATADGDGYGP